MFYEFEAQLPRPLVNRPVFDLEENFLGMPDLLDPEAGLATEFDGKAIGSANSIGRTTTAKRSSRERT